MRCRVSRVQRSCLTRTAHSNTWLCYVIPPEVKYIRFSESALGNVVFVPIIKSSSELQRNFGAVSEIAHETREPIYITRNGEAGLVLMDAEAFEATLDLQRRIYERGISLGSSTAHIASSATARAYAWRASSA